MLFSIYTSLALVFSSKLSAKTARRKMQSSVSKTINLRMTNTLNNTAQPEQDFTETGAEIPNIEITDNFFMPKKQIQRSDGATLSDIYASKKADSWGKILKAQIAEEVSSFFSCFLLLLFMRSALTFKATSRLETLYHQYPFSHRCAYIFCSLFSFLHLSQERMKIVNRHKKEEADKRFGDLLRKQVNKSYI